MLTKKQVCEKVVRDFEDDNGGLRSSERDVFTSSKLAVAMEYLGLIQDPAIKEYCSTRDGLMYLDGATGSTLSFREFLTTLPESCDEKKNN